MHCVVFLGESMSVPWQEEGFPLFCLRIRFSSLRPQREIVFPFHSEGDVFLSFAERGRFSSLLPKGGGFPLLCSVGGGFLHFLAPVLHDFNETCQYFFIFFCFLVTILVFIHR